VFCTSILPGPSDLRPDFPIRNLRCPTLYILSIAVSFFAMPSFLAGNKASFAAKFKHHNSVRHLWEDEWKVACQRGAYPFNEGSSFGDFEPIFQALTEVIPAFMNPHTSAALTQPCRKISTTLLTTCGQRSLYRASAASYHKPMQNARASQTKPRSYSYERLRCATLLDSLSLTRLFGGLSGLYRRKPIPQAQASGKTQ
jgi:hypothetical protein